MLASYYALSFFLVQNRIMMENEERRKKTRKRKNERKSRFLFLIFVILLFVHHCLFPLLTKKQVSLGTRLEICYKSDGH